MKSVQISADFRYSCGKNVSRELRRKGKIPAVLYGQKKETIPISLDPKNLLEILYSTSGHNTIFSLEIEKHGVSNVMIKDWQLDPINESLLHADLIRIAMDAIVQVNVPIVAVGIASGVKNQGGIFEFILRQLEIECLPADIPEQISMDVSSLEIGSNIRVSDLNVESKLKILSDSENVVAHVVAPKEELEGELVEEEEIETATEPEVIKKGKAEIDEGSGEEQPAEDKGTET